MAERWIIDAFGDAPLVLPLTSVQGVTRVVEQRTPPPSDRLSLAPRPEGSLPTMREFENRTVTLKLKLERPTDQWAGVAHNFGAGAPVEAEGDGSVPGFDGTTRRVDDAGNPLMPAVQDLQQAIGGLKASRDSVAGTLTRVMESGEWITFDVVAVSDDGVLWDPMQWLGVETETTIEFTCLPFGRGTERLLGSGSRTAGKRLVTVGGLNVPGDVDALARIELSGASGDQRSVMYAIDQRTAPVERACSTLDRPVSATLTTVAGSVAAEVVQRSAFAAAVGVGLWEPGVLLSQSGAPLVQSGQWRVMVRVRGQAGGQVRLRWTSGSRVAGMTVGWPATLSSGQWELVTLGLVSVPDGAALDGVIEAALPHDQPIQYDTLLFIPLVLGEQHASRSESPAEVLASDTLSGVGNLGGSVAPAGGTWGSVGVGAETVRDTSFASRFAPSDNDGRSHGLSIGSPAAAVVTANVLTSTSGGGDAGIWIGNSAGEQAIAGISGSSGYPGSGSPGAWGVYAAIRGWGAALRWWLVVVEGSAVTAYTSGLVSAMGVALELSVLGPRAQMRVLPSAGSSSVLWDKSVDVATPPSGLRAGIASHGWTVAGSTSVVGWWQFAALAVPLGQDAALFAGRSARHASSAASRVDSSGLRGPVVPVGARPYLPASGRAGRKSRVAVMTTRGDLRNQVDAAPDEPLDVEVYATPRWLQIPGVGA